MQQKFAMQHEFDTSLQSQNLTLRRFITTSKFDASLQFQNSTILSALLDYRLYFTFVEETVKVNYMSRRLYQDTKNHEIKKMSQKSGTRSELRMRNTK